MHIMPILNDLFPCCFKQSRPTTDIIEYQILKTLVGHECLICLETFNEDEIVSLINCGHMYHTHCLYSWFLHNKVCPLCDIPLSVD